MTPTTVTVTSTASAGVGTLLSAILQANVNPGADVIAFDIGSGTREIRVSTALPAITDRVAIDGRTQGGFAGVPLIRINGFEAGAGTSGIVILPGGAGPAVRGVAITQFNGDALRIRANNCRVTGCYVGVLFTGTEELSNAGIGVLIDGGARGNGIGSPRAAARNVISGNDTNGVLIHGRGTNGNGVADTPSARDGAGVRISGGAGGNVLRGNLISANTEFGVVIDGSGCNAVQGNRIGTTAGGNAAHGQRRRAQRRRGHPGGTRKRQRRGLQHPRLKRRHGPED
ncbi:MAG TPA: NosD domain-containing protein [Fimbriiglobus sp.]|nr:NosD domain-containing protein [Fimbriiglobus sp.]